MHKLLLNLFAISTVASSVLMTSLLAGVAATEVPTETIEASCAPIETKAHSVRLAHTKNLSDSFDSLQTPNTDFSAVESDAAVTLFGCDCPACIGALRQLRAQASGNSEGHCWGALQANVSPEEVQQVLQTLETQEAN